MTVITTKQNYELESDSEKTIDKYVRAKSEALKTYILLYKENQDIFPKASGKRVIDDVEIMDNLLDYMRDLNLEDDSFEDLYQLRKRYQIFLDHTKLENKLRGKQ